MNNRFKCIIIDDDEIDRLTILSFARNYLFLDITAVCSSADEAFDISASEDIDVLLLDIAMPGITGLDFRRRLCKIPVCVFITAYTDFAIESYELGAFDFLVKPLKADRFEATMNRIAEYLNIRQTAFHAKFVLGEDITENSIFIKDGHDHIKIKISDIIYMEALRDYTILFTHEKKHYLLASISSLLLQQKFENFIRVHRSYAVQKKFIHRLTANHVVLNDIKIPVGRIYKSNLNMLKV